MPKKSKLQEYMEVEIARLHREAVEWENVRAKHAKMADDANASAAQCAAEAAKLQALIDAANGQGEPEED